ncbi:hypothetical protein SUGI_1079360 [Cryptomeria japonica]|uniref:uncharacterized protein LOC131068143 n=1 Tax=Cryptomeria japonica TaxID=3369 RepID=UPI00241482D5|nr:uncharacterized protein LOC131068143 [Cryptomeria japonica]GLJ50663.1 hypothetical protein SUGI_1079360 [Cryptomeria japonica]
MANIWVRGLKFSNPTALRNVNFIQRSFAYFQKGDTYKLAQTPAADEIFTIDADTDEKITSIFNGKSKSASGGLVKMFSYAPTASVKGPANPGKNIGPPPQPVKSAEKPSKDTGSDPKNRHGKPSKN